ncbi:hypothetical protein [Duganella radicis]|uniref:hypothetical protein n=1 Tax=Duganella radicis TaxID=551988 RepID=UPI001BAD089E|nr:hypothetical protein [Duganella radicis]
MSTISNLGSRWPSLYNGSQQTSGLQKTQASTPSAKSGGVLDLDSRVASVGNATVDFAQDFVNSFAKTLFGDDAKGAVIDFDSASLEASSSYAVGYQHTEGANGVSDAAAFSLTDSSHFIGKGTITTADGRKFDFEVEVQYNYQLDAAASQTSSAPQEQEESNQPSTKDLPTVQLPNIDFPGTLADLFKLIGRDLQTALASDNDNNNKTADGIDRNTLRNLSLRLLNLVDSKDTNTYAPPTAAEKAKAASASDAPADKPADSAASTAAATTPAAADAATAPADSDAAPSTTASA